MYDINDHLYDWKYVCIHIKRINKQNYEDRIKIYKLLKTKK